MAGRRESPRLYKVLIAAAGFVLAFALLVMPCPGGMSASAKLTAAVAVVMAGLWVSELIPIAATALIPVAAFPLLGIMDSKSACAPYGNHMVFLFMGGFFLAVAMERWGLHRRIALWMILAIGLSPKRLVLGFMATTAFLSMWISNTATTLMIYPIALAVIMQFETGPSADSGRANLSAAILLGIAYAASIGGVATLIGTPPNVVLVGALDTLFPEAPEITFLGWMAVGVPFSALFLMVVWALLVHVLHPVGTTGAAPAAAVIRKELEEMGRMSRAERMVLVVFIVTATLWITRKGIHAGSLRVPGWSALFPWSGSIHDSTVAIAMSLLLFFAPVDLGKGIFLLDWEWAKRIPWGVLILFGGGFALAEGFRQSGLSTWLGSRLTLLGGVPTVLMILCVCLLVTCLTELTSNTATATLLMPVLASTATVIGESPLLLMIPAAMSASCAFMLPVATPPNAIVFGSGRLTVPVMARAGLAFNLLGALLITALVLGLSVSVFRITLGEVPIWAN